MGRLASFLCSLLVLKNVIATVASVGPYTFHISLFWQSFVMFLRRVLDNDSPIVICSFTNFKASERVKRSSVCDGVRNVTDDSVRFKKKAVFSTSCWLFWVRIAIWPQFLMIGQKRIVIAMSKDIEAEKQMMSCLAHE